MKLAIAGLGHVAKHHLAALELCPDVDVVAGFDKNPRRMSVLPGRVRHATSLEDLVASHDIDAVLIATPTPTHEQLALRCLAARKATLIEKPAALSKRSFERLKEASCSARVPVFALFHTAYGLEVRAATEALSLSARTRPTVSWHSAFHDPYASDNRAQSSLVNSWIDSGINALSIVQTVLGGVQLTHLFSSHTPPAGDWATESSVQTFEVGGAWSGLVTIECNWRSGINHKSSRVFFGNGKRMILDHTGQTLRETMRKGTEETASDFSNEGERLTNHYVRAFQDAVRVVSEGRSNWEFSEMCHFPYFAAFRKAQ